MENLDKTALRVRVHEGGTAPVRGSADAAGYDLATAHDLVVPARGSVRVRLGLDVWLPEGSYGRVAARSGLAAKHHIDVDGTPLPATALDAHITLLNHSAVDVPLKRGERVAQLVLECGSREAALTMLPILVVADLADLGDTDRGAGGFGSTGATAIVETTGSGSSAPTSTHERKDETKDAKAPALVLRVKSLNERARLPSAPTADVPGYTLYASADATVPARGKAFVPTGIANAVPRQMYGQVCAHPGVKSLVPGAGVIDADYRGEIQVVAFNHSVADLAVRAGDAVAQYQLRRILTPRVALVPLGAPTVADA